MQGGNECRFTFTLPENAHDLMKRDHFLRLGKSTEVN
jgi:hypothetical protein